MPNSLRPSEGASKTLIGRILYSKSAGKLSRIPPFSWIARWLAYRLASRHIGQAAPTAQSRTHRAGLQGALDGIVRDVVEILGFAGAMVATFDNGEVLPVKAFYIDPKLTTLEQIRNWEQQASDLIGRKISLTEPGIAQVYVYKKEDQKNLGVQAAHRREYIVRNDLFDLFTPVAPDSIKDFVKGAQQALGIQQVITVPFFIESMVVDGIVEAATTTVVEDKNKGEFVGNLFAAKCGEITSKDIAVLSTFAQYVASFILSERRRQQVEIIEKLILDIQKNLTSEKAVLDRIVRGMVNDLEYIGAMVATYNEADDVLAAKSLFLQEDLISEKQIHLWEEQASAIIGEPLSLTDENIARVYLNQEGYRNNLSVKAARKGSPVSSTELFDLFTPIAPDVTREFIRGVQDRIGICQVLAIPFFLETQDENGKPCRQLLGNLFAASRSHEIQPWEFDILNAFGQQAAAGLRNVNLYKMAEDRRMAAEIFGKMAFTATASIHALKNHMGVVKGNLQLLKMMNPENETMAVPALKRVDTMITLVENLQEPWKLQSDNACVDVNACIRRAAEKAIGVDIPWIKLDLTPNLPVKTLPEMLTEAFKVLIKNANEAMSSESIPEEIRSLEIQTRLVESTIEISITDHGTGIPPNSLSRIFEMRYTTKQSGLGFGLYWTKDYIEGLGGKIKVESKLGQGTKFTVSLPLASDDLGKIQEHRYTALS